MTADSTASFRYQGEPNADYCRIADFFAAAIAHKQISQLCGSRKVRFGIE